MTLETFVDRARGRTLATHVQLPATDAPAPLVVFAHGFVGHPRKFNRLFSAWVAAGYAVAAPAFPRTSDAAPGAPVFDDVREQPADVSFLLDELLVSYAGRLDPARIAFAGFSLGSVTVLAAAFEASQRDARAAAVIAIAGGLGLIDGGYDIGGVPLLIVHATGDPVVPYERATDLYRRARPPKALVTLHGPFHHEGVEDDPGGAPAVVDAATTAFLDLAVRGDRAAAARLRAAVAAAPLASLEAHGI